MADISGLVQAIANANSRITAIQQDIAQLEAEKNKISVFASTAGGMKETMNRYDLTLGDTWRKNLVNEAIMHKQTLLADFQTWILSIRQLQVSIENAISVANGKIAEQKGIISSCQQQIAQIQAAEEEQRRRQAAAAAAAAAKSVPKSRTTSRRR